mmetsp:Transcript_2/g.8  ORF Transcript_2/g.8 Transcript_2/m.8 type:complete len:258 (+) Transcript_2:82-855(+)
MRILSATTSTTPGAHSQVWPSRIPTRRAGAGTRGPAASASRASSTRHASTARSRAPPRTSARRRLRRPARSLARGGGLTALLQVPAAAATRTAWMPPPSPPRCHTWCTSGTTASRSTTARCARSRTPQTAPSLRRCNLASARVSWPQPTRTRPSTLTSCARTAPTSSLRSPSTSPSAARAARSAPRARRPPRLRRLRRRQPLQSSPSTTPSRRRACRSASRTASASWLASTRRTRSPTCATSSAFSRARPRLRRSRS